MSFERVALFQGSSLIKFKIKTSFLGTISKEKFSLPKFYFSFLQLSSFSKFIFPVDSGRFKPFGNISEIPVKGVGNFLGVIESVIFFSVKIILLLVLHLSLKKGLTVFQNFLPSVLFIFRFPSNVSLVDFNIFEQVLCCRL